MAETKTNIRAASKGGLWNSILKEKYLYMLLLPGIIFYILFRYLPIFGIVIAFEDYNIFKGFFNSEWVGLKNFYDIFHSTDFWKVFRNTMVISSLKIVFGFPVPIIIALMLNEIASTRFKRSIQTIIYLPHFISWVVISGIMLAILSPNYGIAGAIFRALDQDPINLLASTRYFRPILVISDIWKEMGWGTIIYLASLTQIDPTLYEAAIADGANKWKRLWHITLPAITGVIVMMLILRIGNLMNAGFEQILVLQNDMVIDISDIFETFVYRYGLQHGNYSFTTAVGLFNSVIATVLIVSADRISKSIGEEGLL